MSRGDIGLIFYPFASGLGGKRRPALVVQNDTDNARTANTIVAQITTNLAQASEATQQRIEVATDEGRRSGLLHDSLNSCNNPATIEQSRIQKVIGSLSAAKVSQVDDSLKTAPVHL